MNRSQNSLALTYKDAAALVGVEYRTIKLGVERGTIPTVQLGPRRIESVTVAISSQQYPPFPRP